MFLSPLISQIETFSSCAEEPVLYILMQNPMEIVSFIPLLGNKKRPTTQPYTSQWPQTRKKPRITLGHHDCVAERQLLRGARFPHL